MTPNGQPLEYSSEPPGVSRAIRYAIAPLVGVCLLGAFLCGYATLARHRNPAVHWTPQYVVYAAAYYQDPAHRGTLPPGYKGSRTYADPLWRYPAAYGAVAFPAAAVALLLVGRRPRQLGRAG